MILISNEIAPTRLSDRIATLDVLRGIAVCGILLMNIPVMGLTGKLGTPAFPAALNLDWIGCCAQHVVLDGAMRSVHPAVRRRHAADASPCGGA